MFAMEGELSVKLVGLDDIYLAVHDGDNKRFDNSTLRSGESTKTLTFIPAYSRGVRLELVFNESEGSGFQENA
ncbi:36343_t:CDS:2, partial [Racocetra persica]